jgi:hypothetical protein
MDYDESTPGINPIISGASIKEDLEQIDEKTQRIYAYLKALHSGVLFIAWCFIAADILLFPILLKMLKYY